MAKKNNEVLDATQADAEAPEPEAVEADVADAAEAPEAVDEVVAEAPAEPAEPPVATSAVLTIEDDFGDEPLDEAILAKERFKAKRRGLIIVLFLVVVIAVGVFFALQSGMLQGACAGLTPGIHTLDDGTKVNCS